MILFSIGLVSAVVRDCSEPLDGVANDASMNVAISTIDSRVFWQPRFAGEAQASTDNQRVFVITDRGTIYLSKDDGVKFADLTNDRARFPSLNGGLAHAKHVFFGANASSHYYVIGYSTNGTARSVPTLWTTRTGGDNWKVLADPIDLDWIETHPTLPDVALGFAWSAQNTRETFLTTDLGDSWVNVGGPRANTTFATYFACESDACPQQSAVIFQRSQGSYDDCQSGRCTLQKRTFDPTKASADALSNLHIILVNQSDGFVETHYPWYDITAKRWMFSSQRVMSNDSGGELAQQNLWFSDDGGHTWTLALFPFGFERHHFKFVTTETDVILAGVRPADSNLDYGDLYVSSSDERGRFVLSMRHIVFSKPWKWDESMFAGQLEIERSGEVDGTFVANQFRYLNGEVDTTCAQSRITHDYGAHWMPVNSHNGACPNGAAVGNCSLHLRFDSFPTPYAPTDAVGVWVAQGNTGDCLSQAFGNDATWYSNDAGRTWLQMSKEKVIYEVSNHGALVTGAPTERPTNELVYSINDGISFDTCRWHTINVTVNNILTRSFNARNFILEGYARNANNEEYGVLAHFDFSDVHERDCAPSDYEQWPSTPQCLLGMHRYWMRRKAATQCHNPSEYEAAATETPCQCTQEDYECDYCYQRNRTGCAVIDNQICRAITATPSAICNDKSYAGKTYRETDGYKLSPNNRCQGGVQHGTVKPCPADSKNGAPGVKSSGTTPGGNGLIVAVSILLSAVFISVTIGVGVYCFIKKRRAASTQYGALTTDDTSLLMDE